MGPRLFGFGTYDLGLRLGLDSLTQIFGEASLHYAGGGEGDTGAARSLVPDTASSSLLHSS